MASPECKPDEHDLGTTGATLYCITCHKEWDLPMLVVRDAALEAALLKWPCDAGCKAGKIPAYLHGVGRFEIVCARCNGSGIHPIASEALGLQAVAASK